MNYYPDVPDNSIALEKFSARVVTPEYFVENYMQFMPLYIAGGNPSKDTLQNFRTCVKQFLNWCREKQAFPLALSDYQIRIYLQSLYAKGYKTDSVAQKINIVRSFFMVAEKLGLINDNPCRDIHVEISFKADEMFPFFTVEQIGKICEIFEKEPTFIRLRNTLIVYLMGVEGLRRVEVHRACREDIDWKVRSIFIRGKGHDRRIYPCDETFDILQRYLEVCPEKIRKEGNLTPLILSNSNNNVGGRISRNGIGFVMNLALEVADLKAPGVSCHAFRHSCGTNLYAATKDLRLVQETLGHRDPKTTTRYAHLQRRLAERSTGSITPKHST